MLKQEFLDKLKAGLKGLPSGDIEERLNFYSEIIDDRIEEGLSEEEAVSQIGGVDDVIARIVAETPLTKLVKEKVKPKRTLRAWEIVLLVLGSPIWLSLLFAVMCAFFAVYIVLWSLNVCLWAVEVCFVSSSAMGIVLFFVNLFSGEMLAGFALLGVGMIFIGLSIFLLLGSIKATKGILRLTKNLTFGIKRLFIRKENVE